MAVGPSNLNSLTVDASGRATFSGLGSGIDFRATVDAIIAAKRIPIDSLERRVSENDARVAAFEELRSLLADLRGAADALRGAVSLDGAGDAFRAKQAFASTSRLDAAAPSDAAALVGVAVTNAAQATSHTVEIHHIAAAHKVAGDPVAGAPADALGLAGTFELNGRQITVEADDSLLDVRDRINAANSGADATGVTASIVSIAAAEHVLVLSAAETGADNAMAASDGGGVLQALGVLDAGGAFKNELQVARDALLTVDGLATPVVRASNTVDDLFQGVTLSLFKGEPGTTIEVSVERDLGRAKEAIASFVEAYNAARGFINEQMQSGGATDDQDPTYGALYGTSALSEVRGRLSAVLGAGVDGADPDFSVLAQVGITLQSAGAVGDPTQAGTLAVDEAKLDAALLNHPDEVRRLFAFEASSSSADVVVLGHGAATSYTEGGYTLNVAASGGAVIAADVDGVAGSVEVDGNRLTVVSGGAEGLELLYTGEGGASGVRLDVTVGFGARLHAALDRLVDAGDGLIAHEIDAVEARSELARERIDRMSERVERERERLLDKFIAMETALATMNQLLDGMQRQIDAAFGRRKE